MILKYILIFAALQINVEASHCDNLLGELADSEAKFTYCATKNSVPVKICVDCLELYTNMGHHYTILKSDSNCSKEYFDKDRVNLVAATEIALSSLWTKAYCDDCHKDNASNMNAFNEKSSDLDGCIGQNLKNETCEKCMLQYTALNDFYKQMDEHNNGRVCFDMQDKMNRTRNFWSKELKCCRRERDMTFFLTCFSIVISLPFIFYGTTFFVTKRQERNHGILNDEDPQFNSAGPSTSVLSRNIANINENGTTTSPPVNDSAQTSAGITSDIDIGYSKPSANKEFSKLNQETDESSDEEILAKKV